MIGPGGSARARVYPWASAASFGATLSSGRAGSAAALGDGDATVVGAGSGVAAHGTAPRTPSAFRTYSEVGASERRCQRRRVLVPTPVEEDARAARDAAGRGAPAPGSTPVCGMPGLGRRRARRSSGRRRRWRPGRPIVVAGAHGVRIRERQPASGVVRVALALEPMQSERVPVVGEEDDHGVVELAARRDLRRRSRWNHASTDSSIAALVRDRPGCSASSVGLGLGRERPHVRGLARTSFIVLGERRDRGRHAVERAAVPGPGSTADAARSARSRGTTARSSGASLHEPGRWPASTSVA